MSNYKITQYSYNIAKKYDLVIKPSTNVKKKIDVFRNDIKIAQIGAIGYDDYPNYVIKYGVDIAEKRKILYKKRHGNDIHKKNSNGLFANLLLFQEKR